MKNTMQKDLDDLMADLPRQFLRLKVLSKFEECNFNATPEQVEQFLDAILSGDENFELEDNGSDENDTIAFDDDDITDLESSIKSFCSNELPELVPKVAGEVADGIFRTLKKQWPERKAWEDVQTASFEINLQLRWGEAFDLYRMLLTAALEIGEEYHTKLQRSRARKNLHKRSALDRLHARACCVSEEILVLLKAGFADGAMARWRTLHEITIVATLVSGHDDELAERYLLHEIVEAKRALDLYEKTHIDLGFKPPSKREAAHTTREYKKVRKRFGKDYCNAYGWASHHLGIDCKRFSDLEEAAQLAKMRSYYKLASYNVHAGTKGITNQLGLLNRWSALLAGRSNAGLEEPGQNTAISLVQITALMFGPNWKLDDIVMINTFNSLRDKTIDAFIKAGRKLKRDDIAIRKMLSERENFQKNFQNQRKNGAAGEN